MSAMAFQIISLTIVYSTLYPVAGLSLGLRPANERRRYFVTKSLIGWVQA